MSVASRNPFAILNDDESSPADAFSVPATKEQPKTEAPSNRGSQKKTGPASRAGRYYPRGGAAKPATQPADTEEAVAPDNRRNAGEDGARGRGRGGRGRGADRGERRGGGGGRGRPFDRHSQTGKTDSDKKLHQGWGGDEGITELKVEQAATLDAAAEGPSAEDDWSAPTPADGAAAEPAADATAPAAAGRRRFEEEEEDNTLTLDEYLAQKKEKELAALPKLEGRQANEGSDSTLWKDAVPLSKEDEDAYFVGKTKSTPKARTEKKEKVFLEIEARFDRPRGGRGGRGGDRGGDRGFRGGPPRAPRGTGRGGRGHTSQVDVDDQSAFPSLS